MNRLLDGIKVVDFTHVRAGGGPWIAKYDHNQLRITRAIRSLRLLVGDIEADNFRQSIFDYLGEDVDLIGEKAKSFWKRA
jgi:hypothetical protein